MAPKRGKKGLTRMDAALDQMSLMGFPKPLVRKTVNDLLKVYDGAWTLIEEDSYRVVLEVLLNKQESTGEENLLKDASSQHENTGYELAIQESSDVVAEANTSFANISNASMTNCTGTEDTGCWKDIALNKTCIQETLSCSSKTDDQSAREMNLEDSEVPSPLGSPSNVAPTPKNARLQKRKPCYGWISEDEEEEEVHFVVLNPAI